MPRRVDNPASRQLRLEGFEELDAFLDGLQHSVARRVVRSAINAGLTVLAKQIRKETENEPGISPELQRAMKRLVGKRFKKAKGLKTSQEMEAKAGFGVEKKRKQKAKRSGKNADNPGAIGVSGENVHWHALGTKKRYTRDPRRYVGRLTALKIVSRAQRNARSAVIQRVRAKAEETLLKEAKKWDGKA